LTVPIERRSLITPDEENGEEVTDLISDKHLVQLLQEYHALKIQAAECNARVAEIKDRIKLDMEENELQVREVSDKDIRQRITFVQPTSLVYDEPALVKLLKGKRLWARCQTVSVDYKAVEGVVREGKVSVGEVDKVSELKERASYIRVTTVKGVK